MARGRAASTAAARLARIAAGETTSGVMATSSSVSSSSSSASSAAASRALARLFGSRAAGLASAYGEFQEREREMSVSTRIESETEGRRSLRGERSRTGIQPSSSNTLPLSHHRETTTITTTKQKISNFIFRCQDAELCTPLPGALRVPRGAQA